MGRRNHRERPRIALFCGGRGSSSIIRALLDTSSCQLTLLINGFDDGHSTGWIRRLVPEMLGPSDFRKNLVTSLDAFLRSERALQGLLEFRLGAESLLFRSHGLEEFVTHGDFTRLEPPLADLVNGVEPAVCTPLRVYLRHALEQLRSRAPQLAEMAVEVAIGNLVLAGCFLQAGDFNSALRRFGNLGRSRAQIENVCEGTSAWLVALKDNGELLTSESDIVGPQSAVPIRELYLLPQRLDAAQAQVLAPLPLAAKQAWLGARRVVARPSNAALAALARADLLLFGPGTQHSSLLPSYSIVADAIGSSPARAKVLVVNLEPDLDDPGGSAARLVDRALCFIGDPENRRRSVTHALVEVSNPEAGGLAAGALAGLNRWRGITLMWGDWRDRCGANRHDGVRVACELLALLQRREVQCAPVP